MSKTNIQLLNNKNYCFTVVEIKNIVPLTNCDNVVSTNIFGYTAIVNKEIKIGDIGIFIPAETKLSDIYCKENNLYRHSELNKDNSQKGYIEDSRRVKAVKFRGNTSNCLFMPLSSLDFICDTSTLEVGMEFDTINGEELCKKYIVNERLHGTRNQTKEKKQSRVDIKLFPEHVDTSNYLKYSDCIDINDKVVVTQKLHGTSIRIGNILVKRNLNIFEKILIKLGVKIQENEYDYIYGSRKVVKDINNPNQNHYYSEDVWTKNGEKIKGLLPEGYIIYGELIGYTENGDAIQKDYDYLIPQGENRLYVYRVCHENEKGYLIDLTWDQLKTFCTQRGLNYVPEIDVGRKIIINPTRYQDVRFGDLYENCLKLRDGLVDEGVVVRVEKYEPQFYKIKSPKFLEYETKQLDENIIDLETQQNDENIDA